MDYQTPTGRLRSRGQPCAADRPADRSVGRAGRSAKAASGTEKGGDRPPPRFPRKRRGGSVVGDLHRLWFGGTKGSNPLCSSRESANHLFLGATPITASAIG